MARRATSHKAQPSQPPSVDGPWLSARGRIALLVLLAVVVALAVVRYLRVSGAALQSAPVGQEP